MQGLSGVELDARGCIDRAAYLTKTMNQLAPGCNAVRFNRFSTTVVFERPTEELTKVFQLATTGEIAHVVVTPSVTKAVLDHFASSYALQFRAAK